MIGKLDGVCMHCTCIVHNITTIFNYSNLNCNLSASIPGELKDKFPSGINISPSRLQQEEVTACWVKFAHIIADKVFSSTCILKCLDWFSCDHKIIMTEEVELYVDGVGIIKDGSIQFIAFPYLAFSTGVLPTFPWSYWLHQMFEKDWSLV